MSEAVVEQFEQQSLTDNTADLLRAMNLPIGYMSPELVALVEETVEISALAIRELALVSPNLQGTAKDEALKDLRAQFRAQSEIDSIERTFRKAAVQKFGSGKQKSIYHFAYTLSNSVPALVPKIEKELAGAFKQGNGEAIQACTELLEYFGLEVTLPEQPEAEIVIAPSKNNVVPFAKVATVGAVVVGLGLGVVSPAAAAEKTPSPTSSVSAPATVEEQPSVELQPIEQLPSETPAPAEPTTEIPAPTEATEQPEVPAPTASEPTVGVDPVVYGIETKPSEAQVPVFTKQETSPVITADESNAPVLVEEAAPTESQPEVLSNEELQEFVKKLDPEYAQIYSNMIKAYKSGNLNGFGKDTIFNIQNPYEDGEMLNLHMSKKVQEKLLLDIREFQEILKNNPAIIEAIINDESVVIDEAIKEQLALFIQSNDFVEGAEGLTIEQRIALIKSTIKIHQLLSPEAQRVAPLELAKAKKADAQKPTPTSTKSKYDLLVSEALNAPSHAGLENYELTKSDIAVIDRQNLTDAQKDFIKKVYPILIRYQDKYHYNAMIVMSMIIQENNLNPDNDLFTIAHNILSIKAPASYDGPTFIAPTWEQYGGSGEKTQIDKETWIKFESDEACIQYFVEHLLGLSAYNDAQRFYKSPELFVMGLLNNMQNDGDVGKAHHLGATSYATALNYVYGTLILSSQYGLDEVGPDNYRVGYDWSSKTTDGFIIPNLVRGNTFYHSANTKYADEIGAGPRASIFSSVAMAVSHFGKSNVSPAKIKELSNNGSSLREVLGTVGARGLQFEQIKTGGHYIAEVLNGKADVTVVVQGKNGSYVIDMVTDGNGKQGFFVLDPSSTVTTLEPWSFSELQSKLGVTQAYVVKRKPTPSRELPRTLPHNRNDNPDIRQLPHKVEPGKPLKRLSKSENAALVAAASLGLTSKDLQISTKSNGTHRLDIKPQSAIDILKLKPYGGYPLRLRKLPLDAIGTEYNVYSRECVDYVARRTDHDGMGMGFPRWGGRIAEGYGGVAYKWISNAKKDGIRVDHTPKVGSTLAWDKSGRDHIKFGHVAYVEAVLADGSIIVSQYNNGGTGKYSVELISKEYLRTSNNTAFIHFQEGRNSDLPLNTRPRDDSY